MYESEKGRVRGGGERQRVGETTSESREREATSEREREAR
tara:strand:+ start:126 stop:245 length:120 start_codon:yes stop_codon:yes gene_type:complete